MRLIDADKLLEDMRVQLEEVVEDEDEPISKDEALVLMTSAIALKDFVNRQPTAYDIDKVVEQLEKMTDKPMELQYDVPLINHIIEIVKGV